MTHLCRMAHERLEGEDTHPVILPAAQPLSEAQRLRKIILELINTERAYVRDLSMLMERLVRDDSYPTLMSPLRSIEPSCTILSANHCELSASRFFIIFNF